MVNWKTVTNGREYGGLGIGNVKLRNIALLGKWLWRFVFEKETVWHRVIKGIHGVGDNLRIPKRVDRRFRRSLWKYIVSSWPDFRVNIKINVGDRRLIRF